jgi:uncharacterized protein
MLSLWYIIIMSNIARCQYIDKIQDYLDKPQIIKVITGMRRTGKSYFLRQVIELIKSKFTKSQIIYIDKESLDFELIQNYKDLNQYIKTEIDKKKKTFLFIDEIQEIEGWEKAIRSFYNTEKIDIYITGSNSDLLSSELSSYLSGRYIEFPIYPLSFKEFLDFRKDQKQDQKQEFLNFLRYGGLPGIHLLELQDENSFNYIQSVFNTIVLKDVVKKYEIRNVALLENIAIYAFKHLGSNLSAKNIADFLKEKKISAGNDTIQNYLYYLCSAYIFDKARIYDIKGKKIFEINDKYFCNDHGLKHALLGYKEGDIAGLLENIVYLELKRRGYKVYVGKLNNLEIDFMAESGGKKLYIQVCYLLESKKTIEREFKPLLEIQDNYPKYVVSMDELFEADYEGIGRKNIRDFLLDN